MVENRTETSVLENKQRRIFTIGETVLDILFKNDRAVRSVSGGSMLNVAVSLARLGCNTHLISEISDDLCGNIILRFLKDNNIQTDYISISDDGKTAISIAMLDENNDALYDFYRELPDQRLNISLPDFCESDIVAFGSFFAISEQVREPLLRILRAANKAGSLLFYDPNIRKNHCPISASSQKMIAENIALADVVRGSNEDFLNIFGFNDLDKVYESISLKENRPLFMTCGKAGVRFKNKDLLLHFPSKNIQPISTIGAGDTFNAGVLFGLLQNHIFRNDLSHLTPQQISSIIEQAIDMSCEVCMSEDNYIKKK